MLAAPVGSMGPAPVADQVPAPAQQAVAASAPEEPQPDLRAPADPVVVRSASATRDWAASGAAPTGVAPQTLPTVVLDAYEKAVALAPERCHLTVPVLAAIGQVESGNLVGRELDAEHRVTPAIVGPRLDGRAFKAVEDTDKGALDGDAKFDRAVGPLQFLPSTWRTVAVDLDGDGTRDPQDIYDAAGGAMVYLCSTGGDLRDAADLRSAVLSYNHSQAYLTQVLRWKATFEKADLTRIASLPTFSAWAVATDPTETMATAAAPVRPLEVRPGRPQVAQEPAGTPTPGKPSGTTKPGKPTTGEPTPGKPTTGEPTTGPADPGTPSGPGTPTPAPTPAPAPGQPSTPADPGQPTPDPTPTPSPEPTPTPEPAPTPEPTPAPVPTVLPAFEELVACVVPTDPALPQPAPVDEAGYALLVPGVDGQVSLGDGTAVDVAQLCLAEPTAP